MPDVECFGVLLPALLSINHSAVLLSLSERKMHKHMYICMQVRARIYKQNEHIKLIMPKTCSITIVANRYSKEKI